MPPRCPICNNFERKARDFGVAWDCTPNQLDDARQKGCQVCSLILSGVEHFASRFGGVESIRSIGINGPTVDQLGDGKLEVDFLAKEQTRTQPMRLEFFPTGESGWLAIENWPIHIMVVARTLQAD